MIKFKFADEDGSSFWVCGEDRAAVLKLESKLRAQAKQLGCNMRNIPTLGSSVEGNWHPAFKVATRNGLVSKVEAPKMIGGLR